MALVQPERTPPSVWAIAFATALIAGLAGYFVGQASSIGVFSNSHSARQDPPQSATPNERKFSGSSSSDEGDEDEDVSHQEIDSFANKTNEECKLVLVVRTDLGMTKGTCRQSFTHTPHSSATN